MLLLLLLSMLPALPRQCGSHAGNSARLGTVHYYYLGSNSLLIVKQRGKCAAPQDAGRIMVHNDNNTNDRRNDVFSLGSFPYSHSCEVSPRKGSFGS